MSFFDFIHFKKFVDFELSTDYFAYQMENGVDLLSKFNIGMGIGTKVIKLFIH